MRANGTMMTVFADAGQYMMNYDPDSGLTWHRVPSATNQSMAMARVNRAIGNIDSMLGIRATATIWFECGAWQGEYAYIVE